MTWMRETATKPPRLLDFPFGIESFSHSTIFLTVHFQPLSSTVNILPTLVYESHSSEEGENMLILQRKKDEVIFLNLWSLSELLGNILFYFMLF